MLGRLTHLLFPFDPIASMIRHPRATGQGLGGGGSKHDRVAGRPEAGEACAGRVVSTAERVRLTSRPRAALGSDGLSRHSFTQPGRTPSPPHRLTNATPPHRPWQAEE